MNFTLQLVATALTIAFLVVILRMVRHRRLRAKYSFLWLLVGTAIVFFTLVPGLLEGTAAAIGIIYAPALLFLGAIMLLLFMSVHFSWELSRIEERSRTITEELALAITRIDELEQAASDPVAPPRSRVDAAARVR